MSFVHQVLQRRLIANVRGDDHGSVRRIGAEVRVDAIRHRLASLGLPRGDHHVGPVGGEGFSDGPPDPLRGPGDNGVLSGQIKERSSCERHEGFLLGDCEA